MKRTDLVKEETAAAPDTADCKEHGEDSNKAKEGTKIPFC